MTENENKPLKATIRVIIDGNYKDIYPRTTASQVVGLTNALDERIIRKTKDEFITDNSVLPLNYTGIETDTGAIKYGDGETAWNDLKYSGTSAGGSGSGSGGTGEPSGNFDIPFDIEIKNPDNSYTSLNPNGLRLELSN